MDFEAGVPSAKAKYPTKAPTATASITMPLYVMKRSLAREGQGVRIVPSETGMEINSHDEEAVKDLNGIQRSQSNSPPALKRSPIIPSYKQW
jgi:hypothetical protein